MFSGWIFVAVFALEGGYVDPAACKTCHVKIYESYIKTGMGRSFSRVDSVPAGWYEHAASGRRYEIVRRDGSWFMRRDGVVEKRMDYRIGSGNHSMTYLWRKPNGKLAELPVSWYASDGGHWAMSPGYDRPDHADFRREVSDSCLFCHNGYPSKANGGLAAGIDCQRCHGPGEAHAARRGPIVNPAKLSRERQLEVCMQCHLEPTSRTIPYGIRKYNRTPFSYRPGEPLADFMAYFDHPPGFPEKFEVNHAAYRLRQSACFQKSAMTCTTCHDPHDRDKRDFQAACRSCHGETYKSLMMPKRRTQDAPHVIMTDHKIGSPEAPIPAAPERYSGPVAPYYGADELYLAVAQVKEFNNLTEGIARLERVLAAAKPAQPQFYLDLAEARWRTGDNAKAADAYRAAIARGGRGHNGLAEVLLRGGKVDEPIAVLQPLADKTALEMNTLAVALGQTGRIAESVDLLNRAVKLDPDLPISWLNLGVSLEHAGDLKSAESAYREALRIQPDFQRAREHLKNLARP